MPETRTSRSPFPRISVEALMSASSEARKRDNIEACAQFTIAQPWVVEFIVQDSSCIEEAAMRLSAMELFCRALQLQMERGA